MVKISNKVLLAGGLATAIGLSACQKYEDGPAFSLLTKKQRLAGDWEVTKWVPYGEGDYVNGYQDPSLPFGYTFYFELDMEFDKDGDFDLRAVSTYSYYGNSQSYVQNYDGEWEFSSDKEEIELDFDDPNMEDWEIEITRLTNKEFEGEVNDGYINKILPQTSSKIGNDPQNTMIRFEAEKD